MARAVRTSPLAWQGARRSRCACRPAAIRRARTASSRPHVGRGAAGRCTTCCRRLIASAMPAIGKSPSPACISARTAAIWPTGRRLSNLLEAIERHAPEMRFRISSLEPMDCSDEIVDLVAASTCFAPHFHLPLQHASDAHARRDAPAVHARPITAGLSIASASEFPTRRSGPTSSSASLVRPMTTSPFSRRTSGTSPITHAARVSLFRSARHCGQRA